MSKNRESEPPQGDPAESATSPDGSAPGESSGRDTAADDQREAVESSERDAAAGDGAEPGESSERDAAASDAPEGSDGEQAEGDDKAVKDRWWVDFGDKERSRPAPVVPVGPPVGSKFYRAAQGFEQEKARSRLTDNNLKLLIEANPAEGEWGYVRLTDKPFAEADAERIRQAVELPSYARGALIDSGRTVRLLITGTPIGERILELALTKEPSFDCWIHEEWVCERLFKDRKRALRGLRELIERYLSPDGIAAWESDRAGV